MNTSKGLKELDLDPSTLLRLAVDARDPARYYVLDQRQRSDLIAIGDADLARERFLRRVTQEQQHGGRKDRRGSGLPSPWLPAATGQDGQLQLQA